MKKLFSILTLAAFTCLLSHQNLHAQTDEKQYVIAEYMKVKPGMDDKYRECEKVWKLIHQARVKLGLITGWELEQVLYPSGSGTEYDYLTITHLKNWDAIGKLNNSWDDATWATLTKGLSADQKALAMDADKYRDLVKREIWTGGEMLFAPGNTQPKFRVENFMKIPAGGWDAWVEMESKFVKPVHEKNIAMGNMAGWIMGYMVFPRGDDYPYQASTVDFYTSWEQMNKDGGKAWKETYPNMSDAEIEKRFNNARSISKSEMRMLVDFVE
jgi:hypothetical protein